MSRSSKIKDLKKEKELRGIVDSLSRQLQNLEKRIESN